MKSHAKLMNPTQDPVREFIKYFPQMCGVSQTQVEHWALDLDGNEDYSFNLLQQRTASRVANAFCKDCVNWSWQRNALDGKLGGKCAWSIRDWKRYTRQVQRQSASRGRS